MKVMVSMRFSFRFLHDYQPFQVAISTAKTKPIYVNNQVSLTILFFQKIKLVYKMLLNRVLRVTSTRK